MVTEFKFFFSNPVDQGRGVLSSIQQGLFKRSVYVHMYTYAHRERERERERERVSPHSVLNGGWLMCWDMPLVRRLSEACTPQLAEPSKQPCKSRHVRAKLTSRRTSRTK